MKIHTFNKLVTIVMENGLKYIFRATNQPDVPFQLVDQRSRRQHRHIEVLEFGVDSVVDHHVFPVFASARRKELSTKVMKMLRDSVLIA